MGKKDLSESIFFQNWLEHFVLNLWIGVLWVHGPIFAAVDALHSVNKVHYFMSDSHSLIWGEEAEETDGSSKHNTVAQEGLQSGIDSVELKFHLLPVLLNAVEDMLRPHVRYLCNLNLFAELVVSLLDPFDFFVKNLELLLLLFDIVLWIVDAEVVGVDARFDLGNLVELLRHRIPHV